MKNFMKSLAASLAVAVATLSAAPAVADTVTYFHNDLVGSPMASTNQAGQVVWRETYRPYGDRQRLEPASSANEIWFTSRKEDPRTELIYMGARYYDPRIGRFLQPDAVGFVETNIHSFNRYAYASNNPYRYRDPDGRIVESVLDAVSFGLSVKFFKDDPTVLNFLGAVVDGVALAIPVVPGGVGAVRAVARAEEAASAISKEIALSRAAHGEAAEHAADAIRSGKADVLTIDRAGTATRRDEAIGGIDKVPGRHLDEYPPAMFKEGGAGASVRPISPKDNMSAGACIGNACRGLPDGAQVRIRVTD